MQIRSDASSRVVAIDIARGLAIIGMFIAHAAPRVTAESCAAWHPLADRCHRRNGTHR